ncbi:hypothetical protein [Kibdelosporangium aridum]|uniref:hypothetical protein n=1 Tax=Kibdelosporangium aridum TaxID=2030 RepID=UPI0035F0DA0B
MSPNVVEPPRYRAIFAVDIERSTARTNTAKALLREVMYDVLEYALHAGGIPAEYRDPMIDRGDGALVLVRPVDQAPKTLLLNPVIPLLTSLLADHNARHPDLELRLRAVVHAGEIHHDQRGWFGESLDVAFRLLDAPEIKTTLRTVSAPLVLVTSDYIYRSIVRHGYEGIDAPGFAPLRVRTAGEEHCGWAQASQSTVMIAKLAG